MNATVTAILGILGILNILAMGLLAVNAWVHQVTGKASLEARVIALEKASDEWRELKTDLGKIRELQARQDEHLIATDLRLEDLKRGRV